jgi:hypothetical protein
VKAISSVLIVVALIGGVVGGGSTARHPAPGYDLPICTAVEGSVIVSADGASNYDERTVIGSEEYLDISACELVNKLFDNNLTELQREELWKSYEGGSVRWIGKVEDIKQLQEGIRATFSPGIEAVFDKSQMATLLALKKGELCVYSGKLDSFRYPYSSYTSDSKIKLTNGRMIVPEVVSLLWEKEVPIFDKYELDMALPSEPCFLVVNDRIFKGPGEITTWFGDFKVFGINKLTGEVTWEKELPPPESVAQGECRGGKLVAADNDGAYVCVWFQEGPLEGSNYRDTYEIFALDGGTGKVTQLRSLQHAYWGLPYLYMRWEEEINDLVASIAGRELVFCTEQTLPKEATYGELVFRWLRNSVYGGSLQACDRTTGCLLWSKQVSSLGPVVNVEIIGETLRVLTTDTFYAFKLATSGGEVVDETEVPKLAVTSPLKIARVEVTSSFCSDSVGGPCFLDIPALPYCIGDTLAATFTVTNEGAVPITLGSLTVGGRFNSGKLPNGVYPDFPARSIYLGPGESYSYSGNLKISYPGSYRFFCAYQTSDGEWNTSIELGEGLIDEDRAETLMVRYVPSGYTSSDAVLEIANMEGTNTKELYDVIKLVLDIDRAKSKIVGEQDELLLEDVNLLLDQLDPDKRTIRTVEPELPEGTWLELQTIEKLAAPALGAGLTLIGFALVNPELVVAGYYLLVLAEPISQLGQITEMLSMEVGQKVFGQGYAFATVKDPNIGTMDVLWLGPPIDKVIVNIYLVKTGTKGSIIISAGQWLDELKMRWGINAQSTEPIWNAFAYPPRNTLGDPQSIIDHVQIVGFKSPGELRVYDSQGRVTGLVNGEATEEIPGSVYDNELETVVFFSPSDTYRYEVLGTTEATYGLEVTSVVDGEATTFAATDVPTSRGAVHQYGIYWGAVLEGEQRVTARIDSEGDGIFEETKILRPPTASFDVSPSNISVNEEINFDASQSSDADGEIVSYQWDFGDGNTAAGETTRHAYAVPAEYVVSLAVVDNDGVVSTYSRFVQVGERQHMPTWGWAIIAVGMIMLAVTVLRRRHRRA